MKSFKRNIGMSLVEVIIASAIVLMLSLIFISVNLNYYKSSETSLKTVKATFLAEEGTEAVNFIKNQDWNNLGTVGTNYYLVWINGVWTATTTKNYIDQVYERKYYTENVNRDSNSDIILAGGTLDPNTRKLTVAVSWVDASGTTTKAISSYVFKPND